MRERLNQVFTRLFGRSRTNSEKREAVPLLSPLEPPTASNIVASLDEPSSSLRAAELSGDCQLSGAEPSDAELSEC